MDKREDAGEFYPGGKVISTRPVATGGDVKHSDFAGLDVKTNTIPDLREAVRELGRRLGATVVTALAACVAIAATVQTVPVNDLDFDANPSVVTNVTFDPAPDYSTNNTELVETIEATAPAPGDYAAVSNAAVYAAITNALQDAAIAGKQDNLPYPTNAIPYAAISGKPSLATVATSGSYNDLANKPEINGHVLTNNQTGASLGLLGNSGNQTLNGMLTATELVVQGNYPSIYTFEDLEGSYVTICGIWYFGNDALGRITRGAGMTQDEVAFLSDIDAAISPTSPAFSNAVLSVGLNIDTNAVAAINALVEQGEELPIGGATTVGALLLALAAAVAALKRDKANASDLRYSFNTATVYVVTTSYVEIFDLADRANNTATLGSSVTTANVTLPEATPGKMRDFYIRLIIQSSAAPTITFYDPATPATVTSADIPFGASSLADIAPGDNLVLFTEIEANNWLVSVKHEEAS